MNFVFVSPNFPVRNFKYVEALKSRGVNVLGMGDTPTECLHPRLLSSLTEYYYVHDMNDMYQKEEALLYFQNKYGKIDYLESNNEWWLQSDAQLREKFNISTGFQPEVMYKIKAKSAMKEYFQKAGIKTMRYIVVNGPEDKEKVLKFVEEVGYPIFSKPNIGVGASDSYSIKNTAEIDSFLSKSLPEPYIIEEYVDGYIVSFDGICNSKSEVVFATSDHFPKPVAELVNTQSDYYYYSNPFDLKFDSLDKEKFYKAGEAVVKSFGISKRFFHIEFFVLNKDMPGFAKKGEFVALECNMRAPGGNTPDLINYANSVSVYDIYADVICYDENRQDMNKEKFYSFASHRRNNVHYLHSLEEINIRYKNNICMQGEYPPIIAHVMCENFIFAKFKTIEEGIKFDSFVRAKY